MGKRKKAKNSPGLMDSEVKRAAPMTAQNGVTGVINVNGVSGVSGAHEHITSANNGCIQDLSGHAAQSQASSAYNMPPTFPYGIPYNHQQYNSPSQMYVQNPASPVLPQSQQQAISNDFLTKLDFIMSKVSRIDTIESKISRIEVIETKVSKLDDIEAQQKTIISRLNKIESSVNSNKNSIDEAMIKLNDIETSQAFLSSKHDDVKQRVDQNVQKLKQLQTEIKVLSDDNNKLKTDNTGLLDDVVDLQCRSMRDNMIFSGILEYTPTAASSLVNTQSTGDRGDASNDIGSGLFSQAVKHVEDCSALIFEFCQNTLKIPNPRDKIRIDRAHRLGGRMTGRTRSIVVKFKDTDSKLVVKNALREINLRGTAYAVYDQLPPIVQERRKALLPIMIKARQEGKRAVLARDKLYINNVLYRPGFSG